MRGHLVSTTNFKFIYSYLSRNGGIWRHSTEILKVTLKTKFKLYEKSYFTSCLLCTISSSLFTSCEKSNDNESFNVKNKTAKSMTEIFKNNEFTDINLSPSKEDLKKLEIKLTSTGRQIANFYY